MRSIFDIPIQNLFIVAIILKVGSSFLGWWFRYPWSLGFAVPLAIMALYIVLGYKRRDTDLTDEKFADTCYYLGFIFTITSIIFGLFDLPNIGTRIQEIAVRFGAAMVSTVLGLVVRVYLVSFKRDLADAIEAAEDSVIVASDKFRDQLVSAFEKFREFQSEVDNATKSTIERVNMHVDALFKNHADNLTEFYAELTERNQAAFMQAFDEVKTASLRLSSSVDGYTQGMRANLTSIEDKVSAFAVAVTDRLKTTTFPDEYFSKNLAAPLAHLTGSARAISEGVNRAAAEVNDSTAVLAVALKSLRAKATNTETALDKVINLTLQQQTVLETSQGQLNVLEQLSRTLSGFDVALTNTLSGFNASSAVMSNLTTRVESVVAEGAETRKVLEVSFAEIVGKLGANAMSSDAIAGKLDDAVAADVLATKTLDTLGQHASTVIGKVDAAVEQIRGLVSQLTTLDLSIQAQSTELKGVAERIKDVKVTVELTPHIKGLVASNVSQFEQLEVIAREVVINSQQNVTVNPASSPGSQLDHAMLPDTTNAPELTDGQQHPVVLPISLISEN